MNIRYRHFTKPLLLSMLLGTGLLSVFAQPADAHKIEYRPLVSNHYYTQHGRKFVFPRWLRKNVDFQRWYVRSDYRYIRGANWNTLYDMYRSDKRRYRNSQRSRSYRSDEYRSHRHRAGRVYIDYDRPYRRRHR